MDPAAPITVLYADDHYLAVDKPAGLLVHGTALDAHTSDTLIGRLREELGGTLSPVHRLDKATSGVMLFARDNTAASAISRNWHTDVAKHYIAIVRGFVTTASTVDNPVRDRDTGERKDAITRIWPIACAELDVAVDRYPTARYALVGAEPVTGRRHQIRQHLKHLSHPIIGDTSYGKSVHNRFFAAQFNAPRLLLHAKQLSFTHPFTQQPVSLEAAPDAAFQRVLDGLTWHASTDISI